MEMNGGISRGKGDYKVLKCDTETHLPKPGTYQAHIHTHREMHGQHNIYKHCCELEEMRKRKVSSETQASRPSGLACCIKDQRGAGERMTISAICLLGLAVLPYTVFAASSLSAGLTLHARTFHRRFSSSHL